MGMIPREAFAVWHSAYLAEARRVVADVDGDEASAILDCWRALLDVFVAESIESPDALAELGRALDGAVVNAGSVSAVERAHIRGFFAGCSAMFMVQHSTADEGVRHMASALLRLRGADG